MTETLTEEFRILKVEEPEFEKWNELPPEIKLECIKTLDFKTKWSLRSTSHTERALVDTQKLKFEKVQINNSHLFLQFLSSEYLLVDTHHKAETLIPFLEYIFKHGTIGTLQVSNGLLQCGEINALPGIEQLASVKKLELNNVADLEISFWLGCLNEKIEKIEIETACRFDKLLSIPSVSHTHFLQIANLTVFDCAPQLAQIWMDKDVEVGRTFQTMVGQKGAFEQFSKHFVNKIVSETPKHVRIRTENPSKHILLELGKSTHYYLNGSEEFIRMSVIPSDLKELDTYESWVRVLEYSLPEEFGSESSWNSFDYYYGLNIDSDHYSDFDNYW